MMMRVPRLPTLNEGSAGIRIVEALSRGQISRVMWRHLASAKETLTPHELVQRLTNPWCRKHWKACQTPSILKQWKDSLPACLAVNVFHEAHIVQIEDAHDMDHVLEPYSSRISNTMKAVCYAYLKIAGTCFGTWHQGKRAFDTPLKDRFRAIAKLLHERALKVKDGNLECCTDWGQRFVGIATGELEPISFGGTMLL